MAVTSFTSQTKGLKLNNYFKNVSETGVIKVMTDAMARGYQGHDINGWVNLGQGMPEPQKITAKITESLIEDNNSFEYSPVSGRLDLKRSVIEFYNRSGEIKLNEKEISIAPGGRSGLSRILAILRSGNIATFEPDYTAYFEAIDCFSGLNHVSVGDINCFDDDLIEFSKSIKNLNINYFLLSNPCNPTGKFISVDRLSKLIITLQEMGIFVIVDEFYSHWVKDSLGSLSSILKLKDNLNFEQLLVLDGVTKNWMSPGLRVGWIIGNENTIRKINSAGSFLDGGASNVSQKVSKKLIDEKNSYLESPEIQKYYAEKKSKLLKFINDSELAESVINGGSGFYIWIKVNREKFDDDLHVYEKLMNQKIISVPGRYFYKNYKNKDFLRLSFGPNIDNLKV